MKPFFLADLSRNSNSFNLDTGNIDLLKIVKDNIAFLALKTFHSDSFSKLVLMQEMRKSHLNNVVFVVLNAIILIIASLVLKQEMRKLYF